MGVVIEREEWELPSLSYLLLFFSGFLSISLYPYFSKRSAAGASASGTSASAAYSLDSGQTAAFSRFQKSFLLVYSLASVIEGIQTVFGEYEFVQFGFNREQISLIFALGAACSLFFGTFSGIFSDLIGSRKACVIYCTLQLFLSTLKGARWIPFVWIASSFLAICSSFFSFCFETWMVAEHEKHGYRQDQLSDTFWLMTLWESVSLVASQGIANLLTEDLTRTQSNLLAPSALTGLLAILGFFYIRKRWTSSHNNPAIWSYRKSFSAHVLRDKRIWALGWAQASIHFSMSVFWLLWAPTIVADGRDVKLSGLYPLFIGSRMIGCSIFPWFYNKGSPLYNENSLTNAFLIAGLSLSIVAYDYQEVGVLVILFCVFHACVGFILPSLARLRTMYLPNELRGGMISVSLAPANFAILLALLEGGYQRNIANSRILGIGACGLLIASGCIHLLRRWRKLPRQNWRDL